MSTLEVIVKSTKKADGGINREELWVDYHKETPSSEFASKWNDFCGKLKAKAVTSLFYQHVTDEIFEFLLKEEFGLIKPSHIEEDQTSSLTFEEEMQSTLLVVMYYRS